MKQLIISFYIFLGIQLVSSAITVSPSNDATELVNSILGSGITLVGNPAISGAPGSAGLFTDGLSSGLGIGNGIVLTSGLAEDATGPNGNANDLGPLDASDEVLSGASTEHGFPGDPDLDTLTTDPTFDALILEFDFETEGGDLFFNYLFASEEYSDFVQAGVNDVFGFFLDDVNIALVPGTNDPISVDTINLGVNAGFFNNNTAASGNSPFDLEYDGFTDVFTATALNLGPGIHTIRLAISDAGDGILDSAVFIGANTFSDKPIDTPIPEPSTYALFGLGLMSLIYARRRGTT